MSTSIAPRLVDLANLIVAKGTSFVLTAIIFALISRGMDAHAFGEFGYWWSIAIMIGGVLLGGLSSALVRTALLHGSLRHLAAPVKQFGLALVSLAAVWASATAILPGSTDFLLLLAAVSLFGLAVQGQTATLALLRAVEASRTNLIASVLIVVLVPLTLWILVGGRTDIPWVFSMLSLAFALGTVIALLCARQQLAHLFATYEEPKTGSMAFVANATAFTAVNAFSYLAVNIDFTLFRWFGTSDDFAVMAAGKIYFERFVLPALMVFAGAVSLRVLRLPSRDETGKLASLSFKPTAHHVGLIVIVLGGMLAGYYFFSTVLRDERQSIGLTAAICASIGYMLYVMNAILLDVLVVRRSTLSVIIHLTLLLCLDLLLQFLLIKSFGIIGWAIGWLIFNLLVLTVLSRECLILGNHRVSA